MTRQEAKQLTDKHSFKEAGTTGRYIIPRRVVYIIIDSLSEDIESIKKEKTRLKKQLSKNHHIECSCSFCNPVDCSYVDNNFTFTSCDDCKNKIDETYQEICSNCKRFYGCYFEAKELKC